LHLEFREEEAMCRMRGGRNKGGRAQAHGGVVVPGGGAGGVWNSGLRSLPEKKGNGYPEGSKGEYGWTKY